MPDENKDNGFGKFKTFEECWIDYRDKVVVPTLIASGGLCDDAVNIMRCHFYAGAYACKGLFAHATALPDGQEGFIKYSAITDELDAFREAMRQDVANDDSPPTLNG